VTGYRLAEAGLESWQRIFSYSKNVKPASLLVGAGVKGISPAVKRPGCKANLSLPSGFKVENDWIYT
jgi:hypothetical protein